MLSITDLQNQSHKALVEAQRKDRFKEDGLRGAFANEQRAFEQQVKFWPPWRRDGFESEIHYVVHHNKLALYQAYGDPSHPMHEKAKEARKLGLLQGISD